MPQSASQSREIDGDVYEVYYLSPRAANKIFFDSVKVLGPGLGAVVDAGELASILDAKVDEVGIGKAIRELVDRLDDTTFWDIVEQMAEVTTVEGKGGLKALLNVHFSGRLATLYRWLGFAFEVQFRDFYDALAPIMSAKLDAAAKREAPKKGKASGKGSKKRRT